MSAKNSELKAFAFGMFGVTCTLLIVLTLVYGVQTADALQTLWSLSSMLLTGTQNYRSLDGGFSINIIISIWAMTISLVAGTFLGTGLVSQNAIVRNGSMFLMNFLRNSPWLVILYAMLYLIPFEISIFGQSVMLSPGVKAVIGLSLPISANVAEVFRGGIESIPSGQWEASRSLGYSQRQILYGIIMPQAIPLMIPSTMTVYASLFIGTSLVVVTGTNDVLSVARVIIASGADQYATAIYIFVLFLFFAFAFPIAMTTRWLERRMRAAQ